MNLHWISESSDPDNFPDAELALKEPAGLLAAGGDLSIERLMAGYRRGIFPWYEHGQPILWWSPDPRAILFPQELHISRSLARTIRRQTFKLTIDRNFAGVLRGCAATRPGQLGTWITPAMHDAYLNLFAAGHAHSIECWQNENLVGGIYGVSLGQVFFGESMFSSRPDASKVALAELSRLLNDWNFELIDCQFVTPHLQAMGAREISRPEFVERVERLARGTPDPQAWAATAIK